MNAPRKRHAVAYGALLCGVGTLLVLAACEAKVPTEAEIEQMDVAAAQKSVAEAGLMRTPDNDRTDFFLNGAKISAEQARAIAAKDIGSIELVQSELPNGRDTMFVTSADRMPKKVLADSIELEHVGRVDTYSVMQKKVAEAGNEKLVAHIEAERGMERVRTTGPNPPMPPSGASRMKVRDGVAPLILIDGKRATETQLAAIARENIASIAVYKENERLNLSADKKGDFEVISDASGRPKGTDGRPVVSVTTKMARAAAAKP